MKNNSKESLILFILAGIQFTHILDFMIMMPLGPQLMKLFNITPTQFGFLVSSYTFAASISGFMAIFFADRFDRKNFLHINYFGFLIGTLLCALAPSFIALAIGRIVAGLFGGVISGCIYSIIGDTIPAARRGNAMGIVMSAFSLSSVAGVPIGLFIANKFNWNAPFFFVLIVSILLLALSMWVTPKINEHLNDYQKPKLSDYIKTLTNPNHIFALLLSVFVVHGSFSVIPYMSAFLVKNVGISLSDIPYIYLLGGGCTLITARIIGRLSDKFNPYGVFLIVSIIAIFPIISITNHSPATIKVVLLTSVPFMIFISGRTIPLMTIVTNAANPKSRGAFMSLFTSIRHISTASASFLGGSIIGESIDGKLTNYNQVGFFAVTSVLISLIIGYLLTQKIKIRDLNEQINAKA